MEISRIGAQLRLVTKQRRGKWKEPLTGVEIEPPVPARLSDVDTAITIAPVNVFKVVFIKSVLIGSVNGVVLQIALLGCIDNIPVTHCLYSNHSNSHP